MKIKWYRQARSFPIADNSFDHWRAYRAGRLIHSSPTTMADRRSLTDKSASCSRLTNLDCSGTTLIECTKWRVEMPWRKRMGDRPVHKNRIRRENSSADDSRTAKYRFLLARSLVMRYVRFRYVHWKKERVKEITIEVALCSSSV